VAQTSAVSSAEVVAAVAQQVAAGAVALAAEVELIEELSRAALIAAELPWSSPLAHLAQVPLAPVPRPPPLLVLPWLAVPLAREVVRK